MKEACSERNRRVFVGLSGGVDSAVSAAILKKEGYDVTGVFIKAWSPPSDSAQGTRKFHCGWKEERRSAMRAAAVLDIPFITIDLEEEYKKEVVDYMISEYKAGRTPNPDVMCNKEIKFGYFLKWALKNGANFVATGHYARNELRGVNYELCEGKDKNKDQSYFLWTLTQEQLKHILFPIGHLQKTEVRKLAKRFGLPQAEKKDSQGLCFLGQIDMKEFLKEFAGAEKGDVINEKGEVTGEHDGAILYTIGERHGFKIAQRSDDEEPLYVVDKDIKKNTITVTRGHPVRSHQMSAIETLIKDINIIGDTSDFPKKCSCRIRYRQEKQKCTVEKYGNGLKITFDEPQIIPPGQSLVLYDGEICRGGGIMER